MALLLGSVLAGPGTAAAACPNEGFRTGAAAQLPDCRAYEIVSPSAKNGFDTTAVAHAAESGGGVAFSALGALPGSSSAGFINTYLARRLESGWQSKAVSPPLNPFSFITSAPFLEWNGNLTRSIVLGGANAPLTPGSSPTARNLYLRNNENDSYSLLAPGLNSIDTTELYGSASSDLRHVALHADDPLLGGEVAADNVYESVDGVLRLVDILPGENVAQGGAVLGSGDSNRNAVSDTGRVVFSSPAVGGQVFVRLGGIKTVEASRSRRVPVDPNGVKPAEYWNATQDGSAVYFTSHSALTPDARTGQFDGGNDLYRYEADGNKLVDLSADNFAGDPNGAEVRGVVGVSDDGSYVYFVANGRLDGGKGTLFEPNLYVWHGGVVHFIATLNNGDGLNWTNETLRQAQKIESRVSADGSEALITTSAAQPGSDGTPNDEIYRYRDIPTPTWTCVSCRATPDAEGDATLNPPEAGILGFSAGEYLNRSLAGGAVYFSSPNALAAADTNGVTDAYKWKDGQLSLISTGKSTAPSYFADASVDGEDVFFTTREPLARRDTDALLDLYDARVNGGLLEAPPAPPCVDVGCRGPVSAPPPGTQPATTTVSGPGNVKPRHHKKKHHRRKHHKKSQGRQGR